MDYTPLLTAKIYSESHLLSASERLLLIDLECPDVRLSDECPLTFNLLVDVSGSMVGLKDDLIKTLYSFKKCFNEINLTVNLIFFASVAKVAYTGSINSELYDKAVDSLLCGGLTNYGDAFDCVIKLRKSNQYSFTLFITDGYPTTGNCRNVKEMNRYASKIGDCVTIGLGRDLNPILLRQMGEFTFGSSYSECVEIIGSLLGTIKSTFGSMSEIALHTSLEHRIVFGRKTIGRLFSERKYSLGISFLNQDLEDFLKVPITFTWKDVSDGSDKILTPILPVLVIGPPPEEVLKSYYEASKYRLLQIAKTRKGFVRSRLNEWRDEGNEEKEYILKVLDGFIEVDEFDQEAVASRSDYQVDYGGLKQTPCQHRSREQFLSFYHCFIINV